MGPSNMSKAKGNKPKRHVRGTTDTVRGTRAPGLKVGNQHSRIGAPNTHNYASKDNDYHPQLCLKRLWLAVSVTILRPKS